MGKYDVKQSGFMWDRHGREYRYELREYPSKCLCCPGDLSYELVIWEDGDDPSDMLYIQASGPSILALEMIIDGAMFESFKQEE